MSLYKLLGSPSAWKLCRWKWRQNICLKEGKKQSKMCTHLPASYLVLWQTEPKLQSGKSTKLFKAFPKNENKAAEIEIIKAHLREPSKLCKNAVFYFVTPIRLRRMWMGIHYRQRKQFETDLKIDYLLEKEYKTICALKGSWLWTW